MAARWRWHALLLLIATLLVVGCSQEGYATVTTHTSTAEDNTGTRQVDDAGNRLPFDTQFERRWNPGNDGSPYEPCTALGDYQLGKLRIDPDSVADAAGTSGQTLRGCKWRYVRSDPHDRWNLSQFVGDSPGLATSKERRSGGINQWLPDEVISGRQVGVHIYTTGDQCDTYVQSGQASVITMVTHYGRPQPPISEICDRALAFTRATIDKMPL